MLLNAILPEWVTAFTLTFVLAYVAYGSASKAAKLVKQESEDQKVSLSGVYPSTVTF